MRPFQNIATVQSTYLHMSACLKNVADKWPECNTHCCPAACERLHGVKKKKITSMVISQFSYTGCKHCLKSFFALCLCLLCLFLWRTRRPGTNPQVIFFLLKRQFTHQIKGSEFSVMHPLMVSLMDIQKLSLLCLFDADALLQPVWEGCQAYIAIY